MHPLTEIYLPFRCINVFHTCIDVYTETFPEPALYLSILGRLGGKLHMAPFWGFEILRRGGTQPGKIGREGSLRIGIMTQVLRLSCLIFGSSVYQ